ncbi:MAG: DUF4037 domain-containing protein [Anaerolineae bacterium]|nr:DUF4037 domain-containing protein [Anaerolineae bacterium]
MRSLDLNRAYYHNCVAGVLRAHCPEIADRHAAALIGWGSEVLGNDDDYSKKYGWGPRVVLFLSSSDHARWARTVQAVLHQYVPPSFLDYPTRFTGPTQGPPQPTLDTGGVLQIPITTCARFVDLYLGVSGTGALTARDWLLIPEAGLLRLTAGEVFYDGVGDLTRLRETFAYFPDAVWRYKLTYQWTMLSWDIDLIGLCAQRGDTLSARLALSWSVQTIMGLVFLLNRVYKPGYLKWVHRQFYKLPQLAGEIGPVLEEMLTTVDGGQVMSLLYPVLDSLIDFQCQQAGLSCVAYQQPDKLDRGFFAYDLQPVIDALRNSIQGELMSLSFKTGALDQWIVDQDLLMGTAQLKTLQGIYDCEDPVHSLFQRDGFDYFL